MTRPEAIEFLKWLRGQVDICYACHDCITTDKCELQAVIELLEREQDEDDRTNALRFANWNCEFISKNDAYDALGYRKERNE